MRKYLLSVLLPLLVFSGCFGGNDQSNTPSNQEWVGQLPLKLRQILPTISPEIRKDILDPAEMRRSAKESGVSVGCYLELIYEAQRRHERYPDRILTMCNGSVRAGRTLISSDIVRDWRAHPGRNQTEDANSTYCRHRFPHPRPGGGDESVADRANRKAYYRCTDQLFTTARQRAVCEEEVQIPALLGDCRAVPAPWLTVFLEQADAAETLRQLCEVKRSPQARAAYQKEMFTDDAVRFLRDEYRFMIESYREEILIARVVGLKRPTGIPEHLPSLAAAEATCQT